MLGTPVCDELRGYLDVKVPSVSRKKGLLISWKAWRRRWLVVRRFLVSSPLAMDEGAILGRRIELKLTGDDSGNSAAPCPIVVVEEWQEDALVCPTKSRSHPYAFGLFPQPGCDPVLFLSGRTAEESRRWLASIRSLLVPPYRPCGYRLSSISSSTGEDVDGPFHHSSPLSSSPETYQSRCIPRSQHVCFPPLPPLPSRCRLRRRSSLESLTAPGFLMDRRRSLSDSELPNCTISERHHHRRKCQTISSKVATSVDSSRNDYLMEDDDQHIYAGIGDSGVCSSLSNVSRSFLSSSSSSSCSSSPGFYAYASPSSSGFTSYIRANELEELPAEISIQVPSKGDDPSLLTGKVASSLVTAGIGLMLSTPVHLDGVSDLHNATFQRENTNAEDESSRLIRGKNQEEEADMDRRESITSGIYEEIQEDEQSLVKSKTSLPAPSMQTESSQAASPPPLPPRSPSQCLHLLNGRQRELAWFLGVHSNSCPASDVEDDEPSRESSPVNGQDSDDAIMTRRKISEPSGTTPVRDQTRTATISYSRRRRKNLESFLGVMEFGSKAKEINKTGVNVLNKSLGALELVPKSEKDFPNKERKMRMRTYTEVSQRRLDNVKFQESHRSSSAGALLSGDTVVEVPQIARGTDKSEDSVQVKAKVKIEKEVDGWEKYESQDNAVKNLPTVNSENTDFPFSLFDNEKIERCHSFSCSPQRNKADGSDKRDQSPKSPRSIAKRLQMMKKPNLMKLVLKEQTKQQELPSLRDKTKQVINRSLETLGWLGLATSHYEDSRCNLVVGGSSFYRSATCTGVDFQTERQNVLRRGAAAKVYKDGGKKYNGEKLDSQKLDTNTTTASCSTESPMEERLEVSSSINLLEGSAICSYHKSQLKKMDRGIGQTLEDIERLAKQELICEQICNLKLEDDSHYIPMRPLKKVGDEVFIGSKDLISKSENVMPEEDYISMEGITASTCKIDKNSHRESFDPVEDSINSSAYSIDADIYMSMEGRKSTQEELAQR